MEFNSSELKAKAIEFIENLRFPLEHLKIEVNGNWKTLDSLSGIYETPGGRKLSLKLKDILLDTGNEIESCLISAYYLEEFKKKFKDVSITQKIIGGVHDNPFLNFQGEPSPRAPFALLYPLESVYTLQCAIVEKF